MANVIFASNNLSHFPTAIAGSVSGTFDSSRVPYTLAIRAGQILNSPVFTPVAGDTTWFHSQYWFNSFNRASDSLFCSAFDAAGNLLFKINKIPRSSGLTIPEIEMTLYDGNTVQTVQASSNPAFSILSSFDASYQVSPTGIAFEMFTNKSSVGTISFGDNPNSYGKPVRFSIGGALGQDNDINPFHWSEIIVADSDTRNARMNLLRPNASGAFSQWNGQLAVLADDDTTTGLTTLTGGVRQTMTMTDYLGANNVSNVVLISSTTRGQNAPTGLQHTVRLSGVDYDNAIIHPVDFSLEYQITDYLINPATSLPWEGTDLSLIETGFVSVV